MVEDTPLARPFHRCVVVYSLGGGAYPSPGGGHLDGDVAMAFGWAMLIPSFRDLADVHCGVGVQSAC